MPEHRWSPRCSPPTLVVPIPVDPTGTVGPTRGQARGPKWRQTSAGLFVPAGAERAVEQRILEAAMLLPEGEGAVSGWAALRLMGARFFDGLGRDGRTQLPVPLIVPGERRRGRALVEFRQDRLDPDEVVIVQGIRCAWPRRAVFDAMRFADDVREATVAMDMTAAAGILSIERVRRYVEDRTRWAGVKQVRAALALADEDSRSPQEVRARLVVVLDAGLPKPKVNPPVFDLSENLLGYADLFDEEAGMAVEYDGDDHRSAGRHSNDVDREAKFRRRRIEVGRLTGPDLEDRPHAVRRLLDVRSRSLFLPPAKRDWTLEQPDWFPVDPPLDYRLDLEGEPY